MTPTTEGKQFTFEVTSCVSLLELFDLQEGKEGFNLPECRLPSGDSYILWERARNLNRYKVGKYDYISGTECETALEAIIEITDSGTFLLYQACLPPAHFDTIVTRKLLSGRELDVINHAMNSASSLIDQTDIGLEVCEIQGAKSY